MSEMTSEEVSQNPSWIAPSWCSWTKFSESMLRTIEKKILSHLKTAYRGWYVDIGPVVGPADKIWTISLNPESNHTPLVLLHGLGSGVGLWCLNLDAFAATRPVYAIDILGFGRSSRPTFSTDGLEAEQQFVRAVEEWRAEMNLESFILLGHSMGGFLAASYALSYPNRIKHLILADPWGFADRPLDTQKKIIPLWIKAIAYLMSPFNPLAAIRVAGPWGQWVVDKVRSDITKKFSVALHEEGLVSQYIYQCNSQTPSGESAFHCMMAGFGWAKNPMVNRIDSMDKRIPITLLYGSRSWVDNTAGEIVKEKRMDSYVKLQIISGAGHHVYADRPEVFNKYVLDACSIADGMTNSKVSAIKSVTNSEKTESDEEIETTVPTLAPLCNFEEDPLDYCIK